MELSPYYNIISRTLSTLVMFGSQDYLVPVSTAKSFQKQMEDLNNICQLIILRRGEIRFFQWSEN